MSPEKRPPAAEPPDHEIPDIEAFMARYDKKMAERTPDGAFAEYQDKIAFSIVDQIMPLALDAAPAAIENTMENMPWGTLQADRQIVAHVNNPSGIFNRALLACLDEPAAEQSTRIFAWLATQAQALPADTASRSQEEQRIWRQKISMLGLAYLEIKQKEYFEQRAFGQTTTTPEAQSVIDALESHMAQIRESILALAGSDTAAIMGMLDAELVVGEHLGASVRMGGPKTKILRRSRHVPEGLYEIMKEAGNSATSDWHMTAVYHGLSEPLETKWSECEALCSWEQVNQILTALPSMQSTEMRVRAADALSDMSEVQLAGVLSAGDFPAVSLAQLIHYDIYANVPSTSMPYEIAADRIDGVAEVEYEDVTLPRDMAPAASVALLGDIAECNTAEEFEAILLSAQEAICGKPSRTETNVNEWLLTLSLLRKSGGSIVRERTDAFIARDDFPHPTFKEVITNRRPGSIYLLSNGKIRVADNLSGGYCLATSSAGPAAEQPQVPKRAPASSQSGPQSVTRDKGEQVAPGKNTTKRRRHKAARNAGATGVAAALAQESASVASEPQRPSIVMPLGETLESIGSQLSQADLALVAQAIAENQTHGRHPIVPLRARGAHGNMLCKLRVNGVGGGIRVILMHIGGNRFETQTIQYRGGVYKNLPH